MQDQLCGVHTGTHDNNDDTAGGWFASLDEPWTRIFCQELHRGGYTPEGEIHWDLVRAALGSVADLASDSGPGLSGI